VQFKIKVTFFGIRGLKTVFEKNLNAASVLFQKNSSQNRLFYFFKNHFNIILLIIKYLRGETTM
jgi:hypothetical protein